MCTMRETKVIRQSYNYLCTTEVSNSMFTNDEILVARVKKIIHADDDIQSCSNNAAFVITIATEMFIQHLVERTHEIVKAEKRPRRNVQYGDVGAFSLPFSLPSPDLTRSPPSIEEGRMM